MSNDLFTDEIKIQEMWQQLIDDGQSSLSVENSLAFLDAYKKLLKNIKRLVRHSDRVEKLRQRRVNNWSTYQSSCQNIFHHKFMNRFSVVQLQ